MGFELDIVQVSLTLIIALVGFLLTRLYKSVDNLVETTQKLKIDVIERPNYTESEEIAVKSAKYSRLEHEADKH